MESGGGGARGQYLEQWAPGQRFVTAGRTVGKAEISQFIGTTAMFEELFTNREYAARATPGGRPLVPALLTTAMAEGLVIQTGVLHRTGVALLDLRLQALAPVHAGDTLEVEVEVVAARPSRSRPDVGIVETRNTVRNQAGRAVLEYRPVRLIRRRPAPEETR